MEIKESKAPSYQKLRPLRPQKTKTLPVFDDLAGKLVDAEKYPDDEIAYVMGICPAYGYSDGQTMAKIMARLELEDNNCPLGYFR